MSTIFLDELKVTCQMGLDMTCLCAVPPRGFKTQKGLALLSPEFPSCPELQGGRHGTKVAQPMIQTSKSAQ